MEPLNDTKNISSNIYILTNNLNSKNLLDNIHSSNQMPLQINTPSFNNREDLIDYESSSLDLNDQNFQKSPNLSISSTSDYSSSYSETRTQNDVETKTPIKKKTQCVPIPVIQKPDGHIRVKILCLFGALLPGIGCYLCITYTYLFQFDRVLNFTSIGCDNLKRF